MKIIAHLHDMMANNEETVALEVEDSATIHTLIEMNNLGGAEVSKEYYPIADPSYRGLSVLPYVIVDNAVTWDPIYRNVYLRDFFSTHNLRNEIRILHSIPQAGGPNLFDVAYMWQQFYQILIGIDPIVGVGVPALGAAKYLLDKVQKRQKPADDDLTTVSPGAVFSFVLERQQWNAKELASLLNIEDEDSKHLLKLCRYEWDAEMLMYVQTPDTETVISKLNEARWG